METKYRLTYFNFKALAENIRFLFAYGEIEFEDNRIDPKEWPKLKDSYPNGKLPLLEIDGKSINQSLAIGRFVARKVGLAGSDEMESMLIDSAVENLNDIRVHFVSCFFEADEASKPQAKEKLTKEVLPLYLPRLEAQVQENGGYFVGGKLTWADIYLAAYSETFTHFHEEMFAPYPGLQGVIDKVYAVPTIKSWLGKRPKTDF